MRQRRHNALLAAPMAGMLALWLCVSLSAQVPSTRPPNSNITAPGPRQQQPPGRQQRQQLPGVRAPQPTRQTIANGTIEGFVYWDASHFKHNPASSCSGLAITVSVGSSSGSPLTSYTPIGTLSNNFKHVGQVKQFLAGGRIAVYDVCTYGFNKVPVGPNLQVQLAVTQPGAFSPVAMPQFGTIGPIQIVNGRCNMLPRITNPTAGDLTAHWGSCQNMAYDVNFAMHVAGRSLGGGGGAGGGSITVLSGQQTGMLQGTAQRGMLAPGTTQSSGGQSGSGMLLRKGPLPSATKSGTPNPASKVELNSQPLPPRVQMRNADVIRMLTGGLAESVIINAIQGSAKRFDFSPKGCQALGRAHASPAILAAMAGGSTRTCRGVAGNASGVIPAGNPSSQSGSLAGKKGAAAIKLKPVKLSAPTALRKLSNARLAQQNAAVISLLDQQKVAAQQDSAAMKLSLRSAATARTPVMATNFRGHVPASGLTPGQTQSSPGNAAASLGHLPPFNSVVLACSMDQTPRILRVNGGQAPGIFTPEAKYNQYTIVGCTFGQAQGTAHIFAGNGFTANLYIDFWSNNGITAHLDPALAGVLDQNNVTLVVVPTGQQQIQKSGFKFYAARGMPQPDGSDQEVALTYDSMPQARVNLYNANPVLAGYNRVPQNGGSKFPSFSFQGTPVAGWVFRYAYGHSDAGNQFNVNPGNWSCFINDVSYSQSSNANPCANYFDRWQTFGTDTWDFSGLLSGFAISSYELYYENIDASTQLCCSWDNTNHGCGTTGNWDFNLTSPAQITVTWPVYWCWDTEATPFDRLNQQEQSAYGLAVWVLGPRCVDPWTGRKDQRCMTQVKQILG